MIFYLESRLLTIKCTKLPVNNTPYMKYCLLLFSIMSIISCGKVPTEEPNTPVLHFTGDFESGNIGGFHYLVLTLGASNSWDANTASFHSVLNDNGVFRMWYAGKDVDPLPSGSLDY